MHAQATLGAEQMMQPLAGAYCAPHPFQAPPGWEQQWAAGSYPQLQQPDAAPPIAAMLVREANAWTALLQLHGAAMGAACSLSAAAQEEEELRFEEGREAAAQREANYVASLSQLAAAGDALVAEAIKIRSLRRAKHQVQQTAVQEVMRAHSNETLALGDSLARNSALGISSATVEMRASTQAMRAQIQQARALLEEVQKARALRVPAGSTVVMGLRIGEDDSQTVLWPVEELLASAYQTSGRLDEESLAAALAGVAVSPATPASGGRTFARRCGDRALQKQLVPEAAAPSEAQPGSSHDS
jgi:hypothetical protein